MNSFKEGTGILIYDPDTQEDKYVPIESLKKGILVKTYLHGYRRIQYIHHNRFINDSKTINKCMYIMKKTKDMPDDLIVTGGHSVLMESSYSKLTMIESTLPKPILPPSQSIYSTPILPPPQSISSTPKLPSLSIRPSSHPLNKKMQYYSGQSSLFLTPPVQPVQPQKKTQNDSIIPLVHSKTSSCMIDDKYLCMAYIHPHFSQITDTELYHYYHFSLENEGDTQRQYGIWANGILTECMSEIVITSL
jgi:hypothetical protein